MSRLLRHNAKQILSELNHSTLEEALRDTKRRSAKQGVALCIVALLFWAVAMLIGPLHVAGSFICLMLCFGLACAMLQSLAIQVTPVSEV